MELAKKVKTHKFAILVVWRALLAPVQPDTNRNNVIDTHMGRME